MRKMIVLFLVFNILNVYISAQNSYIKDRWNIKLGYSLYSTNMISGLNRVMAKNFRIEANYGVLNFIESGAYLGYSKFDCFKVDLVHMTSVHAEPPAIFYGLNCNLHVLPLFIKENDFRFDLYLTGKLGGMYIASREGFKPHGNQSEYSVGGGVAFYLLKHLGCFAEYTYGKYYYKDYEKFRYGLSIKF